MGGTPWLSQTKKIYVTITEKNGEKRFRLVRPERKSVSWIEDLVQKDSKPGELIVDLFPCTFATANPFLELLRLHRLWAVKLMQNALQQVWEG